MVWARCHFAGLASGIDWIAWSSGVSAALSASVWDRTERYASRSGSDTSACLTVSFIGAPLSDTNDAVRAGFLGTRYTIQPDLTTTVILNETVTRPTRGRLLDHRGQVCVRFG